MLFLPALQLIMLNAQKASSTASSTRSHAPRLLRTRTLERTRQTNVRSYYLSIYNHDSLLLHIIKCAVNTSHKAANCIKGGQRSDVEFKIVVAHHSKFFRRAILHTGYGVQGICVAVDCEWSSYTEEGVRLIADR